MTRNYRAAANLMPNGSGSRKRPRVWNKDSLAGEQWKVTTFNPKDADRRSDETTLLLTL